MTELPADLKPLLLEGNALDVLRSLPADSFHATCTSGPYWGVRAYQTPPVVWGGTPGCGHRWESTRPRRTRKAADATSAYERARPGANYDAFPSETCSACGAWRGELGQEPTPEMFVDHVSMVFEEVRRVTRPEGIAVLVIGDTMATHPAGVTDERRFSKSSIHVGVDRTAIVQSGMMDKRAPGLKEKDVVGVPWMVAFRLRSDGWYLRQVIVWSKPNPNRNSVRDRPGLSHEYVLLLAKSNRSYWDIEGVRHEYSQDTMPEIGEKYAGLSQKGLAPREYRAVDPSEAKRSMIRSLSRHAGSTLQSVWEILTPNYDGPHYAVYGDTIPEIVVRLGTSQRGVCPACGAPHVRRLRPNPGGEEAPYPARPLVVRGWAGRPLVEPPPELCDWVPSCGCGAGEPVPALVLDPFVGKGTTCEVARRLGRRSVGIDLNIGLAREETGQWADLESFAEVA